MNIEQAKELSLVSILERIGVTPEFEKKDELWFKSPLREEKTASFHVKPEANIWYDFGEGVGGNTINFVCAYLKARGEDDTVADALRWLKNMTVAPVTARPRPKIVAPSKSWILKRSKPLENLALTRYLASRGISAVLGDKHLSEVYVQHPETGKGMYALGFKNEDGGYEMRNPFFKSCVTPKTITFVRGEKPKPKGIHVFEGFVDYLSAATRCPDFIKAHDSIVLNSLSCLNAAFPYIMNYGYEALYSWLDNDTPGQKITMKLKEFAVTQDGLVHKPMNNLYSPHKDVNAWHIATMTP